MFNNNVTILYVVRLIVPMSPTRLHRVQLILQQQLRRFFFTQILFIRVDLLMMPTLSDTFHRQRGRRGGCGFDLGRPSCRVVMRDTMGARRGVRRMVEHVLGHVMDALRFGCVGWCRRWMDNDVLHVFIVALRGSGCGSRRGSRDSGNFRFGILLGGCLEAFGDDGRLYVGPECPVISCDCSPVKYNEECTIYQKGR